jgi:hypothetical protein
MSVKMHRGKRQVLFNYLPGRTFDFAKTGTIARVTAVRGVLRSDLNLSVVLRKVAEMATAWPSEGRPVLRDDVLRDPSRFVLLDPKVLQADLFPKVFWCDNNQCGRISDYSGRDDLPAKQCGKCHSGHLVQLRFVRIHRCGALEPLIPPTCKDCHSRDIALDTRGSERVGNFRWVCRACRSRITLYAGYCQHCQWTGDERERKMDIEVHRAGRTYYAHTAVLLNVPRRQLDRLFSLSDWPAVVAAMCLGLPEVAGRHLSDWGLEVKGFDDQGISGADLDELFKRQATGELSPEDLVREMQALRERRRSSLRPDSNLKDIMVSKSGVSWPVWEKAGQEMLEAVMPFDSGQPVDMLTAPSDAPAAVSARQLGLSRLALVADYPILTTTFGFSRADYNPKLCRLNPFPPEREHDGRFPIYVDQVQADALLFCLDTNRVLRWLQLLGHAPDLPHGSDQTLSERAFFVQLLHDAPLHSTLGLDQAEQRLVFGLLHTLSHIAVRQASILCGLEATSLSEYLLPRSLTFALYCNHRFGATIGALTALFEQSAAEWLSAIKTARHCVYDPVCRERESSCHACTHLAETSCRHFNLNLSRALLFGGNDGTLGEIPVGFLDPRLA